MGVPVLPVTDRSEKANITNNVLRSLPDWFAMEEAIVEYVRQSLDAVFWCAYVEDRPVGFLSLKHHNPYTQEIFCMGIHPDYHRLGLGQALVKTCEAFCIQQGAEFLTVKTLDESRPDPFYARTRAFYMAMGFRPLEVFPTLWDADNPCLLLAKRLPETSSPLSQYSRH